MDNFTSLITEKLTKIPPKFYPTSEFSRIDNKNVGISHRSFRPWIIKKLRAEQFLK